VAFVMPELLMQLFTTTSLQLASKQQIDFAYIAVDEAGINNWLS